MSVWGLGQGMQTESRALSTADTLTSWEASGPSGKRQPWQTAGQDEKTHALNAETLGFTAAENIKVNYGIRRKVVGIIEEVSEKKWVLRSHLLIYMFQCRGCRVTRGSEKGSRDVRLLGNQHNETFSPWKHKTAAERLPFIWTRWKNEPATATEAS